MNFTLSPSKLSLMLECKRCFWLTVHEKWKRPEAIKSSLPNGLDKILKAHFDRFMKKGVLPPELCGNKECRNLKLFDDYELLCDWRSNRKGIRWQDSEGNVFFGAIDNLLVNTLNQKLIVLDYKTRGFPLKEDSTSYYQFQLDSYNFLFRKNKYETEDFSYLLFYIPKEVTETGEIIFDKHLKKIQTNPGNAEETWINALKMLRGKRPKEKCEWCQFVK
jgi:hypothetical protein